MTATPMPQAPSPGTWTGAGKTIEKEHSDDLRGPQGLFHGLVRENGHWIHPDLKDVLSVEALSGEQPEPEALVQG